MVALVRSVVTLVQTHVGVTHRSQKLRGNSPVSSLPIIDVLFFVLLLMKGGMERVYMIIQIHVLAACKLKKVAKLLIEKRPDYSS